MDEPNHAGASINAIHRGDCIAGMNAMPEGSVDLVFADPPFNIGYDYDVYDDSLGYEKYLAWSRDWISAVHRVLKKDGTFWLAIGDEFAAELKLASQQIGFHCRSWVVWYYTFGVNCTHKFTRSHAHLFYFVKDPRHFTFRADDPANRIPSARQLVYNDRRANPKGRLPDDTWIIRPADAIGQLSPDDEHTWTLRPQDLDECFGAAEDTWYFPRVAGTFKERAGFHGCQMPEQLLGRIIRTCSTEDDVVLDPFSGSATTLAVAKKLARRYVGFDVSADYVKHGESRLAAIRAGDPLDGSAEPLVSAPKTRRTARTTRTTVTRVRDRSADRLPKESENEETASAKPRIDSANAADTYRGIVDAFRLVRHGFSADRVVADPEVNQEFVAVCRKLGIPGTAREWNLMLFRLRKSGKLADLRTTDRTIVTWQDCDPYLFASEVAWKMMIDESKAKTLDDILCDPTLAEEFDRRANRWTPGYTSLEYRWAALKIRKQARLAHHRGSQLPTNQRFRGPLRIEELNNDHLASIAAVYVLRPGERRKPVYVGESQNLRNRFSNDQIAVLRKYHKKLLVQWHEIDLGPVVPLAWQSCIARKYRPELNIASLYQTK